MQVHDSLRDYGKYLRIPSTTIYGGVGMGPQQDALRRGVDLIVATPGRLIDHMDRRNVDLSGIEILVLDEADRMLDMGFLPAIKRILAKLPKQNRQTLLFSATFVDSIKKLAHGVHASIRSRSRSRPSNTVADTITHRVHPVDGTAQARPAAAPAGRLIQPQADAGLRPHQARLRQAGQVPGQVRHQGRGDPRQQERRAHACAR